MLPYAHLMNVDAWRRNENLVKVLEHRDTVVDSVVRIVRIRCCSVETNGAGIAIAVCSLGSNGRKKSGGTQRAPSTKKNRTSRRPAYVCSSIGKGSSNAMITESVKVSIFSKFNKVCSSSRPPRREAGNHFFQTDYIQAVRQWLVPLSCALTARNQ